MKRIILTCTGDVPAMSLGSRGEPPRFIIDVNDVGDAQIVRDGAALVDRDRRAGLGVSIDGKHGYISLAVETEL